MSSKATLLCFLFFNLVLSSINGVVQSQLPWHVDLFTKNKDNSLTACGGTLIKDHWILTAAHCISRASSIVVLIAVGDNSEYVTIANHFIVHENYKSEFKKDDIALVHVHAELPAPENILPVPLPTPEVLEQNLVGVTGVISGFGDTIESISPTIRWLHVVIVDQKECLHKMADPTVSNLCAVSVQGDQHICRGDDGGGLIIEVGEVRYLFGIALTNTTGCIGSSANFENVGDQLEWIEEAIKNEAHYNF